MGLKYLAGKWKYPMKFLEKQSDNIRVEHQILKHKVTVLKQ